MDTREQPITRTPVLIVGAGPAGLVTALDLARQGVASTIVERHPGTSIFPRATAISLRSMEILRGAGLEDEIRAFSAKVNHLMSMSETLASADHQAVPLGFPSDEAAAAVSPTRPALSPQDHLEPVIVRRLQELGMTEFRFDTELVAIDQDAAGVTARLKDRRSGAQSTIAARFLVGADGGRSTVRELLGIEVIGATDLQHHAAILFRADLWSLVGARRHGLYMVAGPDGGSIFAPEGPDDRWVFAVSTDPADVDGLAADPARAAAMVRAAAGAPDLAVEIVAVMPLTFSAELATRWRVGNVFLIGDAAHRMPPYGGRGMNTAIADAHNLAWKLAWVIREVAAPALLDSYEAERGPVGRRNIALALTRFPDRLAASGVLEMLPADVNLESTPDGLAEDMGYVYGSAAIVAEDGAVAQAAGGMAVGEAMAGPAFRPQALPGARAPHAWLQFGGGRVSTVELVEDGLVLIARGSGEAWRRAARAIQPRFASWLTMLGAMGPAMPPVPTARLTVRSVGGELIDPDGSFASAYDLADGGAVLVRPDGHIAARWRTAPADHRASLAEAVATAIGERQPAARTRPIDAPVARPAVGSSVREPVA
jgi:putative polyketide hydroxylase